MIPSVVAVFGHTVRGSSLAIVLARLNPKTVHCTVINERADSFISTLTIFV